MTVKLVLVDWGGVCASYDLEVFHSFLRRKGCSPELSDRHFREEKDGFDCGAITEEGFWTRLKQKLGFKGHWRVLAQNNKKNLHIDWQLLKLIRQLKRRVRTALLSNMDKTSVDAIRSTVNLAHYFDKVYFSCEYKCNKMSTAIIRKIMQDFGVKPCEVLFVDDYPGNIRQASRHGMQTLLYTKYEEAQQKLQQLI